MVYIKSIERIAGRMCVLILIGFALAGLAPFDPSPENVVAWIRDNPGLRFQRGVVLGPESRAGGESEPCTIEILFRPRPVQRSGTILEFYDPTTGGRLGIRQIENHALSVSRSGQPGRAFVWFEHPLVMGRTTLAIIVSDGEETQVYLNGRLTEASEQVAFTNDQCGRPFALGSGASSDAVWTGDLLRLAFFSRALTPDEIQNVRWPSPPRVEDDRLRPDSLYLFDEQFGDFVRDQGVLRRDLFVPASYRLALPLFLTPPSFERMTRFGIDWKDVVINIGGFVPFGFFLLPVLAGRTDWPGSSFVLLLLCAFGVSLSIETLQYWLPTRTSSLSDVSTNVLGAGLGALAYMTLKRRSRASPPRPLSSSPS